MGLFKSREERRLERNMQVRKAVTQIRRQIADNAKHEVGYIKKAKRARQLGATAQYEFLKKALKKTATIRVRMERQLLTLEAAMQIKEQTEGHLEFAQGMGALSKSIAEVFGSMDMAKTQVNFEQAMAKASSLEERVDTFLEMAGDSMYSYEGSTEGDLVSDDEIDRMLEEEAVHDERGADDDAIAKDIDRIEKEISKARK